MRWIPIPDVTLPDGYAGDASGAWTCHTIKGCSAVIDGTKGHGFVTFGHRLASDPTFLAVVSGRWTFVQIEGKPPEAEDDANWVGTDHLEVWVAEESHSGVECVEHAPVEQWGVRMSDGQVFPGVGKPATLLRAERATCGPHTIEMRIELPEKRGALTVAHSAATAHKQRMLWQPVSSRMPTRRLSAASSASTRNAPPARSRELLLRRDDAGPEQHAYGDV